MQGLSDPSGETKDDVKDKKAGEIKKWVPRTYKYIFPGGKMTSNANKIGPKCVICKPRNRNCHQPPKTKIAKMRFILSCWIQYKVWSYLSIPYWWVCSCCIEVKHGFQSVARESVLGWHFRRCISPNAIEQIFAFSSNFAESFIFLLHSVYNGEWHEEALHLQDDPEYSICKTLVAFIPQCSAIMGKQPYASDS